MLNQKIIIEPFCYKQFTEQGSVRILYDRDQFQTKINELYRKEDLIDGYAPFCKHLFIENFTETPNQTVKITEQNEHLLRSSYRARTEKELPVLVRYFLKGQFELVKAKYLDLILYSREQVIKENEAMGNEIIPGDYDWALVSVKPQDEKFELPMNPITMMRNSLGKDQGGSGVPLDREKYLKSVEFWEKHALVD